MIQKPGTMREPKTLFVVAPLSNTARFHSRYRLYRDFERRMRDTPNVELVTVELAFGDRAFEATEPGNPHHVQLRTDHEMWHKENLINIGISRLPANWEYVAWIDADVQFTNPHWTEETIHQLQHHHVVQLFQDAIDLGPIGNVVHHHKGFARLHAEGVPMGAKYPFRHPGFAWAASREAINHLGGLPDWAILGAADHHLALALIGEARKSVPQGISPSYMAKVMRLQERCDRHIQGDIGFVNGTILHHWHGKKADRKVPGTLVYYRLPRF